MTTEPTQPPNEDEFGILLSRYGQACVVADSEGTDLRDRQADALAQTIEAAYDGLLARVGELESTPVEAEAGPTQPAGQPELAGVPLADEEEIAAYVGRIAQHPASRAAVDAVARRVRAEQAAELARSQRNESDTFADLAATVVERDQARAELREAREVITRQAVEVQRLTEERDEVLAANERYAIDVARQLTANLAAMTRERDKARADTDRQRAIADAVAANLAAMTARAERVHAVVDACREFLAPGSLIAAGVVLPEAARRFNQMQQALAEYDGTGPEMAPASTLTADGPSSVEREGSDSSEGSQGRSGGAA